MQLFTTRYGRVPFLFFAIISLLSGILVGLYRMGFHLPPLFQLSPALHPALMISGFLGTVISLERAVAYAKPMGYLAPLFNIMSIISMFIIPQTFFAPFFALLAATTLAIIMLSFFQRQPTLHSAILGLAPFFWMMGSFLWMVKNPFPEIVHWWTIFLVLTIAGERLELSRIRKLPGSTLYLFVALILLLTLGALVSIFSLKIGWRMSAFGFIILGLWLLRYDMALLNVKQKGLPRFIALALLSGYIWLLISGTLTFFWDGFPGGFLYDAFLHALFLGFLFSMIFGHAPVIFPSILMVNINPSAKFYTHLGVLHLSLLARILGDILGNPVLRSWGALFNGVAIILFFIVTITSIRIASRKEFPVIR
ncbi:MAG: hypothetical protein D6732_02175 [Methanobacteriota archaeon]|nr:MAG: hypothetical protein D6732_02175 [Euryarchaeota archaeon]